MSSRPNLFLYAWLALLAYIFVGGAFAQILGLAGAISPYCTDASEAQSSYPTCTACGLYWSVFGVIEVAPCNNNLLAALLQYGIAWPHAVTVMIAIFIYPAVAVLRMLGEWAPAAILPPLVAAAWIRTIFYNFVEQRDVARGLHWGLCLGVLVLATLTAVRL